MVQLSCFNFAGFWRGRWYGTIWDVWVIQSSLAKKQQKNIEGHQVSPDMPRHWLDHWQPQRVWFSIDFCWNKCACAMWCVYYRNIHSQICGYKLVGHWPKSKVCFTSNDGAELPYNCFVCFSVDVDLGFDWVFPGTNATTWYTVLHGKRSQMTWSKMKQHETNTSNASLRQWAVF